MLAGENTEIPVWMAEADHCMIHKAMEALDDAADEGPLTICKVRAILEDIAHEWPECGDISQHQLEMVPRSHVQLLWLLGACRDPETGVPHVAPDGHLVCLFEKFRAQARTAFTPSTPEERQTRQDLGVRQRLQQRAQRAQVAGHAAAADASRAAAKAAEEKAGRLQRAVQARTTAQARAMGRSSDTQKDLQDHRDILGLEGPGFSSGFSSGAIHLGRAATHLGAFGTTALHNRALQHTEGRLQRTDDAKKRHLASIVKSVAMKDIRAAVANATQTIHRSAKDLLDRAKRREQKSRQDAEARLARCRQEATQEETQAAREVERARDKGTDALNALAKKSDKHRLDLWIANRTGPKELAEIRSDAQATQLGANVARELADELEGVASGLSRRAAPLAKGAAAPIYARSVPSPPLHLGPAGTAPPPETFYIGSPTGSFASTPSEGGSPTGSFASTPSEGGAPAASRRVGRW
jgi:hypothetical protein